MVNKIQKIDKITLNYVKSPNPEGEIAIGTYNLLLIKI